MKPLTEKQLEALRDLHKSGPKGSYWYGSTTVNRLRKEGFACDVVTPTSYGPVRSLKITEAGLAVLGKEIEK